MKTRFSWQREREEYDTFLFATDKWKESTATIKTSPTVLKKWMQKITKVFCHAQAREGLCFCHQCLENCGIWGKLKKNQSFLVLQSMEGITSAGMWWDISSASSTHHFSKESNCCATAVGLWSIAHLLCCGSLFLCGGSQCRGTACQATVLCFQLRGCKVCGQREPVGLCSPQHLGVH